ncbi:MULTISPECIES: glutaredoxin family protein [Lysinibacillus]|uniref:Glutaredoxin family protein n=1 Tax=Lysinibacillus xylanilyticus TaxID=582475 RepID=A0ABT4EIL4_9BACI|nr:glutaredoxin family protein [Lysinibacillus xylanilyticus]MCY9545502.1 glutaredoxin family protein [Lysinibacillus xylanilyticus]MED3801657.1 glutaredoxin family protein [Lysinibacillus xylanilyticus]QPQ29361.1 glutaredoxin family protein [Lysinibacillus sp. JNUCC-51]
MNVKFFSRDNCGLCVDGLLTLKLVQEDINFDIEIINIEEDESIHEKYMLMIPVVEKDGRVIQYGNLDYATLMEHLCSE